MHHCDLFVEEGTVVVKFVAATEAMSNGDGTEVLVLHRFLQTRLRLLFCDTVAEKFDANALGLLRL